MSEPSGFSVHVTCTECGVEVAGSIEFDEQLRLSDTPGFLWLGDDGIVCDACEPSATMIVGDLK